MCERVMAFVWRKSISHCHTQRPLTVLYYTLLPAVWHIALHCIWYGLCDLCSPCDVNTKREHGVELSCLDKGNNGAEGRHSSSAPPLSRPSRTPYTITHTLTHCGLCVCERSMQLCGLSVRAFDIHGNRTTALHMILHRNYDLDARTNTPYKVQTHRVWLYTHTHTQCASFTPRSQVEEWLQAGRRCESSRDCEGIADILSEIRVYLVIGRAALIGWVTINICSCPSHSLWRKWI